MRLLSIPIETKAQLARIEVIPILASSCNNKTASIRKHLGLYKNKIDKSKAQFNTHAIDGVAIAGSHFVNIANITNSASAALTGLALL